MATLKNENNINWLHNLLRKSRTPWSDTDYLRITWYLNVETKQGIYEYRDCQGKTNGFAITAKLQEQLPTEFNQKYFSKDERAIIFAFYFDEISDFIRGVIEDSEFFNFTGVPKDIFCSLESYDAFLKACEDLI